MITEIEFCFNNRENRSKVVFGKDFVFSDYLLEKCKSQNARFAIITDQAVEALYGQELLKFLNESGLKADLFSFPSGEKHKNRETKSSIEDRLLEKGFSRDTVILALGGGVVTDMAGFIAATFCRGVPMISIPTTLLGMVDASIGGKSGVNTPYGKNLIGAFCQPQCVMMDKAFLRSLPQTELKNGLVEMIKHGLIADEKHFLNLENSQELEEAIRDSCQIKMKIINQDEREGGIRRLLNFGHTVGHAIEKLYDYQIPHGQAVAIGIIAESHISHSLGHLKKNDFNRILKLFKDKGIDVGLKNDIDKVKLLNAMSSDKKSMNSVPRFVIIDKIGSALEFNGEYCTHVDPQVLLKTKIFD